MLPQLERELERIERQGWVTDAEEAEVGVRCVAHAIGHRRDLARISAA